MGFLFGGNTADKLNQGVANDPNLAKNQALIDQQRAALTGQPAPQMNTGQADQTRGVQNNLMNQLQQQAMGQGPSLATAQANQVGDRGIAQQMAMAAGSGGNPALAQRNALMNQANISQGVAATAAQARTQEQLNAQQALAGVAGQARSQDITQAGNQASLDAAHQQQVNSLTQQYIAMGMSADQAQFMAQQEMERTRAGMIQGDANRTGQGVGGIISAAGSVGAALV